MSTLPAETGADLAHEVHQTIVGLKAQVGERLFDLGRYLCIMKEKRLWKVLGHETFETYLGDPELGFRRTAAYRMIGCYDTYVRKLGLAPKILADVDAQKLYAVRRLATKDNIEEIVHTARTLSRSELYQWAKEQRRIRLGLPPLPQEPDEPTQSPSGDILRLLGEALSDIVWETNGVTLKFESGRALAFTATTPIAVTVT